MQAIKVLVVASKDLQKEIVESGRVSVAVVSALSPSTCAGICLAGPQLSSITGGSDILRKFTDTVGS
jgi:hypothetical protein